MNVKVYDDIDVTEVFIATMKWAAVPASFSIDCLQELLNLAIKLSSILLCLCDRIVVICGV